MRLFKKKIKVSKNDIKEFMIRFSKGIILGLQWFIIILGWTIYIFSFIAMLIVPYWIIIYPILILVIKLIVFINHKKLLSYAEGNTIVHGNRGAGKGLIFQYVANKQSKILSNVYFGSNTILTSPKEYFESISPNTSALMVANMNIKVNKREEWEKVPYFLDDTAIYFPNYLDSQLKKDYKSMSLFIPLLRHLYDSWVIMNVQDIERSYKILRELQTDGYIKALRSYGKGYIWNKMPILRKYMMVKWRYHEKLESAVNNVIPFNRLGIV
ncbi:MAG: hypothetical protein QXW48_04470, partial [Thermoplasmata archaeon]